MRNLQARPAPLRQGPGPLPYPPTTAGFPWARQICTWQHTAMRLRAPSASLAQCNAPAFLIATRTPLPARIHRPRVRAHARRVAGTNLTFPRRHPPGFLHEAELQESQHPSTGLLPARVRSMAMRSGAQRGCKISRSTAAMTPVFAYDIPTFATLGVDTLWLIGYTVGGFGTKWEIIPGTWWYAKQCGRWLVRRPLAHGTRAMHPVVRTPATRPFHNNRLTHCSAARTPENQPNAVAFDAVQSTERDLSASAPFSKSVVFFGPSIHCVSRNCHVFRPVPVRSR